MAPDRTGFHVFVSYNREDEVWVLELAKRLRDEEKLRVWLDKWEMVPGKPWQDEMENGLCSSDCCVVCVGDDRRDPCVSAPRGPRLVRDRLERLRPVEHYAAEAAASRGRRRETICEMPSPAIVTP